jgi:hypothetical protein
MHEKSLRLNFVIAGLIAGSAASMADPPKLRPRDRAVMAVEDFSNHLNDRDVADRAKKIVAEHDSCDISGFFMVRHIGGFGVGKLAKNRSQDSVHFLVLQLAKNKKLTESELDENQADYLRVAKGLQAMAQLAPYRGSEFTHGNKTKEKAWADVSVEFQRVTAKLRTAIEERDPKKVRLSAESLSQTCAHCHALRD